MRALFVIVAFAAPAEAGEAMVTGKPVVPPAGFVDFCARHLRDCLGSAPSPIVVELSAERWRQLMAVQEETNRRMRPRELPPGVWEDPTDESGDCNQFALAKRRALLELGWPREAVLLSVAITEQGDGHLLLIVRTSDGDLALDNRVAGVVDWTWLRYRWVSRQSQLRPTEWLSIEGREQVSPPGIARPAADQTAASRSAERGSTD